jgi:uncharacterized tellurite resistance protein B-like protein
VPSSPHRLAFVKVIAAMAWADGVVDEDERNRIKVLLNRFATGPGERREVEALLSTPVPFDEALRHAKDFAGRLAPPGARGELLREIEALLGDDAVRSAGERELLKHVRAVLGAHTPVDGLVEKLRGLVGRTLLAGRRQGADGAGHRAQLREALHAAVDEARDRDTDRVQRIAAEYNRIASMNERLAMLDELFAAAATDHFVSREEVERIRKIADLLWISNPEYLAVRHRYRDRITP